MPVKQNKNSSECVSPDLAACLGMGVTAAGTGHASCARWGCVVLLVAIDQGLL